MSNYSDFPFLEEEKYFSFTESTIKKLADTQIIYNIKNTQTVLKNS
jgi:hypothetical protein